MDEDIKKLAESLPTPHTAEEQYLYVLACETAGVSPSKLEGEPFNNPFWRMEQYWHCFCKATKVRLGLPFIPDDDTVTEAKLTDEVKALLLGDGRVKTSMLANQAVTADKLSQDVVERLAAARGEITEEMLQTQLAAKLLGPQRITLEMLSPELQEKIAKIN